ncbi:MAG: flagellar basal body rod protein FlgC [Lentisphaerae bacterium RIFOXYA12_FULL_48_11]|nr:MAG: flagellar basal body rod protein FlgC [Lentisphaerae bacterium RIFOXYA12_FULL_48_11]
MSDNISLIPSVKISTSGLDAENRRIEVIANNIANANTVKGADGKVFRRQEVIFAAKLADAMDGQPGGKRPGGVEVKGVVDDNRPLKRIYRPGHPDADKDGYINMPDINPVEEMVSMMSATRAFEANLAAIKAARNMAYKALEIGK